MGSFNDFRNTGRDGWKFNYTGKDLLPHAKKKLEYYERQEMAARKILSVRLADPSCKANSSKNEALRNKITTYGTER
ncbi:MAG: hypothetical protein ACREGR_02800, partial [Minisyncoccia bacterium]